MQPRVISFTILGAPRTKKNSPVVISRKANDGTGRKIPMLLPSEQYRAWLKDALTQGPGIRRVLTDAGVPLPLIEPISVSVLVYREREVGDALGYWEAISDAMQEPTFQCSACKKTVHDSQARNHGCRAQLAARRQGLGIIRDDRQIQHWDGSRLLVDADRPRIEVMITVVDEPQAGFDFAEKDVEF